MDAVWCACVYIYIYLRRDIFIYLYILGQKEIKKATTMRDLDARMKQQHQSTHLPCLNILNGNGWAYITMCSIIICLARSYVCTTTLS